jgi:putative photosynthetic complex assembly protein 2
MSTTVLAIAFGLFTWWFSTGLIIMMVRANRSTHAGMMAIATLGAGLCLVGLVATRDQTDLLAALAGFTYGIAIWGWLELSFLYGYITGPRRIPQAVDARGWDRFTAALGTVSSHELAILAAGLVMVALSWDAQNQIGLWTFLVLWVMRISAKLNLFFGVPNVSDEFLPGHLSYLSSYFDRRRVSLFFPVSVTLSSLAFGVLAHAAFTAPTEFQQVALTLVATLLLLAIIEHWFLVLPIRDAALWRWALQAVDVGRISSEIKPVAVAESGTPGPYPSSRDAGRKSSRQA